VPVRLAAVSVSSMRQSASGGLCTTTRPAMCFCDATSEGEAEADAAELSRDRAVDLIEDVEDAVQALLGDARPRIGDLEHEHVAAGRAHRDGAALGRELDRVVEEVRHRAAHLVGISERAEARSRRGHVHGDLLVDDARARVVDRALGDLREVVLAGEEVQAPRLERGDVEEGVDQAAEARDPRVHCDERLALHRRERAELLGEEELEVAHRRRHRRRELVAQVAEELAAQARELLEPLVGLDELGHLALEALDDALRGHAELHVARVRRTLLVAAEEALDLRGEAAHVDRLLDEAIAAHGEARLAVAFGRDRHDRHA
jgi:hypothetical protein